MRKLIAIFFFCSIASAQIINTGSHRKVSAAAPSNLYYGLGCTGSSTNTCTAGDSTFGADPTRAIAFPFTTGAHAVTVDACALYVVVQASSDKKWSCAIYTWNGIDVATLVTNCAQGTAQSYSATGFDEKSMTAGCSLSPSTTYYIAFEVSSAETTLSYQSGTSDGGYTLSWSFQTWPATISGFAGSGSVEYSTYIKTHY